MIGMTVLWILCWVHAAAAGTHSLSSLRVVTIDGTELAEHVAVGMVDDVKYYSYNSTVGKLAPLFDWINTTQGREFWERTSWHHLLGHDVFKWSVRNLVQHFNRTGVHIFQHVGRCELDDDGTKRGQLYQAYDGKDFVSFDVDTMSWVAAVPQARIYKHKRETDTLSQQIYSDYYQQQCFELLKTFLQNGKETLQRKVRPEVSVIQRKAPRSAGTEVLCHVTGFYPREVDVSWVRDRETVLEEGVWSEEVLPNGDGTYQLRKTLTVSAEDQEKRSYSCQVDHSSLEEAMNVKWVPQAARHTWLVAVGVPVAALVLIAVFIRVITWKKRTAGVPFSCCSAPLPREDEQDSAAAVPLSSTAGAAEGQAEGQESLTGAPPSLC
ncbi:major histocompatibility complex class I-related gene protein-like isoform X1 [Polyodon spathula]|uniref:major histocompatibility complex class I-related gene protein-like isoform X1 n=2 Tax=Polyodon spathula TaxID=7913 RepID=UPI001B7E4B11|nr:major histocompatibility complex class I-related gene protein-like isoform X1 [Polyodon spathula]